MEHPDAHLEDDQGGADGASVEHAVAHQRAPVDVQRAPGARR